MFTQLFKCCITLKEYINKILFHCLKDEKLKYLLLEASFKNRVNILQILHSINSYIVNIQFYIIEK